VTAAINVLLHGVGKDSVPDENFCPLYSGSFLSSCYCEFAFKSILLST